MKKALLLSMLVLLSSVPKNSRAYRFWNQASEYAGGQYFVIPNSSTLNITGSLTCELFYIPTLPLLPTVNQMLLEKTNAAGNGFNIYLKNGKVTFQTNGNDILIGQTVLQLNVWTHLAVSYNSATDSIKIYINGVLDASAKVVGAEPNPNSDSLRIGLSRHNPLMVPAQGQMDEIRIWSGGQTGEEINNNMRLSLSGRYNLLSLSLTFQNKNAAGSLFSLKDWSGNGNDAINNGVTAVDLSNQPSTTITDNNAFNFDGTNYVSGADNPDISPTNAITLEAWINPFLQQENAAIIHKGPPGGSANYGIQADSDNVIMEINGNSTFIPNGFPIGIWTHVAATYDASTGIVVIYINAEPYVYDTLDLAFPINDGSDSLYIGGTSVGNNFEGKLDEVRISNYAKSANQIKNEMSLSIDKSNEPNPSQSNVSYCFDGSLYDICDNGPLLQSSNGLFWDFPVNWLLDHPSPVLRADALNFSKGFHLKRNQKNIPVTGTSGQTIDSLIITSSETISDAELFVSLQHEDITDLTISLIAPNGNEVIVYNGDIKLASQISTVYDDNSTFTWEDFDWVSTGPSIRPLNLLGPVVSGLNSAGLWRLKVTDNNPGSAAASTGRLYGWGIRFNAAASTDNVIVAGALFGDGAYATLTEAFTAINAFAQTAADINITIEGNTNEPPGGAQLNAGTWSFVRIEPNGHRTISGAASAGQPLIDLNGADRVTINGIDAGGNSLNISNTTISSLSGTSTIRFQNDATNNKITRCRINGSSTSAVGTFGGNIWFAAGATTTGNDNNVVSYCEIGPAGGNPPSKGIYFSGTTSSTTLNNSGDSIIGCNIYDYFSSTTSSTGIYIRNGSTDIKIKQNKFYQTAPRVHTANSLHTAISIINTTGNNFGIDSNIIGYASPSGTGVYTISGAANNFKAINLRVGATTPSNVQGNTISAISHSTSDFGVDAVSPCMMIFVDDGIVNVGNVAGNLIGDMLTTGNITYSSSSANTSAIIGISCSGSGPFLCNGNFIGGITASNSSTGASNIYGIRVGFGSPILFTCQENTIGGAINNSIHSTTTSTSSIVNGILSVNAAVTITGNNVKNLTASGGTGMNASASVIGIKLNVPTLTNNLISKNTIHTLSNTNPTNATVVTGMHCDGNLNGVNLIEKNFIHSLQINNDASTIIGIRQEDGISSFENNMIRLGINAAGNSINHGASISGIVEADAGSNFYFNSVYIGGNPTTGSSNTNAFTSNVGGQTRSYINNIFYNARSNAGSTGKHYSVNVGGSGTPQAGLSMDYNVLRASGSGGFLGRYSGADITNLLLWQTATAQDANSYIDDPHYLLPTGTSVTLDLHIDFTVPTIIEAHGFDIPSILQDFDDETRSTRSPVDIGADAGQFIFLPAAVLTVRMYLEGLYNASTNSQTEDTVTVEIRESISPYNIHHTFSVISNADGMNDYIVDPGPYWIVLKHRNSIETWSAAPVTIAANDTTFFDFSSAASQAFGNNMKQVDTSPVRFGINSGDVNHDCVVDASDAALIDNDAFQFTQGYVNTDLNGDEFVDGTDYAIADNNSVKFVSCARP